MTEPRLLEGWKEIAEFMRLPERTLQKYTHELHMAGAIFSRTRSYPDKRKMKRIYAWTDLLRNWEVDRKRKEYREKRMGMKQSREIAERIDPIENGPNTG